MIEIKISNLDIILNLPFLNEKSKLPTCFICEEFIPLTNDNKINNRTCASFQGDYWHKKCMTKEKKGMDNW